MAIPLKASSMRSIKLDRRFYRHKTTLIDWCATHIGTGGWEDSDPALFPEMPQWSWKVSSMFGYLRFTFTEIESLQCFKEFLADLN